MLSAADYYMESAIPVAVNYAADVMIAVCLNLYGFVDFLSKNTVLLFLTLYKVRVL